MVVRDDPSLYVEVEAFEAGAARGWVISWMKLPGLLCRVRGLASLRVGTSFAIVDPGICHNLSLPFVVALSLCRSVWTTVSSFS